jgi:hypothetical protein
MTVRIADMAEPYSSIGQRVIMKRHDPMAKDAEDDIGRQSDGVGGR